MLLEVGLGVGRLWSWNCSFETCFETCFEMCFEAESSVRGCFFSAELGAEWKWPGEGVGQPEIERCLNHLVDRHDLRRDIELGARVDSAVFDEPSGTWLVVTSDAGEYRARFLVATTGVLPIPPRSGVLTPTVMQATG